MDRIYLDTSFFIGLLENQDNRRAEARRIIAFETPNDRFTSILTLNEFMVRIFDDHKHDPNCEELLKAAERKIRSIVRIVAFSDEIAKEAARRQSIFGEIHKHASPPKEPRDRKFRWDAIHIATAWIWKCDRIYAWDGKWDKLPEEVKVGLGEVIAPAKCPILFFDAPEPLDLQPSSPLGSTAIADSSVPIAPLPPSEQSPVAPPVSTSPPELSPPSVPHVAPEQPPRPE